MNRSYVKFFTPPVGAVLLLAAVTQLPLRLLGLGLRYGGGILAVIVVLLYVYLVGKVFLIEGLRKLGSLAWGDVIERHMYTEEELTKEDVPHWTRIWVAYASSLLQSWLQGNFQWVSFRAYYNDMVPPLLEGDEGEGAA